MDEAPTVAQLHALEVEFGLSAREVLDIINSGNHCKIAVRGAIAEGYLIRYLRGPQERGEVDGFEDFDRDGYPDCRVDYRGHAFLVECKNVKADDRQAHRVEIDFQRTRNPIGRPWERYYLPTEFDVVAACLWNRTGRWEHLFAATGTKAYQLRAPIREAIAALKGEEPIELVPEPGETMRHVKVVARRSAKEAGREIEYGETREDTLLVWLAEPTRRRRRRRSADQGQEAASPTPQEELPP
jgi:hypothetical protein